ncbi:CA174 protein, partial [Geococcyx californianus]|nr:CA174 protein [Geococcyx californianus]
SSPHDAADKRPLKRLKYEKSSPVKSELEELPPESQNPAALGETPETSDGDERSEGPGDHGVTEQKKGESIPEAKDTKQEKEQNVCLEPCAAKSSSAPPKMDSAEDLQSGACSEEESSGGSVHSDGSSSQEAALPKKLVQPDPSAFLNEDSNQPMPVDRFFGDIGFLQDVPAAAHPMTAASRREFRKLQFIAKEEEEEEEEEE